MKRKILKACSHSLDRRLEMDGLVLCLSGFCRLGLPPVKKYVQRKTKYQKARDKEADHPWVESVK